MFCAVARPRYSYRWTHQHADEEQSIKVVSNTYVALLSTCFITHVLGPIKFLIFCLLYKKLLFKGRQTTVFTDYTAMSVVVSSTTELMIQ